MRAPSDPPGHGRRPARRSLRFALLGLALAAAACGPPQVTPDNRRLVESLLTAVSARNSAWLAENERLIEARQAGGALSDAEHLAFRAIIDQARTGDWPAAERAAFDLRDAQRPTRAEVRALPEPVRP